MAKRSKNAETEKLDYNNVEKVIALLESDKPITKKTACEILCIAYNTSRLDKIIEKHKEKKARDKELRSQKRGKPAQPGEIQFIISGYLEGSSLEHISDSIYRSTAFVKGILDHYEVPIRARATNYNKPELIPDGAVRQYFNIGERVWSTRYNCMAEIHGELPHPQEKVYRVWLVGEEQWAYQPASELASLEKLKELGINL